MKRALLAVVLVAACVPPTEKIHHAGAVGFVTTPSPEARGEPFTTVDGWTVRIERLVLQAYLSAEPFSGGGGRFDEDYYTGDTSSLFRWNAADAVELYVPALGLKDRWIAKARFRGVYSYEDKLTSYGVDDRDEARLAPPDRQRASRGDFGMGPMMLVVASGVKGGRKVTLDAAFATKELDVEVPSPAGYVDVREDELSSAPVRIDALRLFEFFGQVTFDPVAEADTDGDGIVTAAEAAAKRTICIACGDVDARLDQAMESNLRSVFRAGP